MGYDNATMTGGAPMDENSRKQHHVPPGGAWYWRQNDMLAAYTAGNKRGHTVAWDKAGEGVKAYGLYGSAKDCYTSLLECKKDMRFAYELIPINTRCRAYADVEWVGEADTQHATLKRILAFLRNEATKLFPKKKADEWEIHVACGTRPRSERIKHSYHITIFNLIFERNEDMAQLFAAPLRNEEFMWTNEKNERVCMVDQKVYTNNRVIRTLYSTKRCTKEGDVVPPLRRLKKEGEVCGCLQLIYDCTEGILTHGHDGHLACKLTFVFLYQDPCVDDFTGIVHDDETLDDVLRMVLTHIDPDDAPSAVIVPWAGRSQVSTAYPKAPRGLFVCNLKVCHGALCIQKRSTVNIVGICYVEF
jgi:hypothetical protein